MDYIERQPASFLLLLVLASVGALGSLAAWQVTGPGCVHSEGAPLGLGGEKADKAEPQTSSFWQCLGRKVDFPLFIVI